VPTTTKVVLPWAQAKKKGEKEFECEWCCPRKIKDHMVFSTDEENTCTSSKGPSNKSQPNDQTIESPLKKIK
jgi:hypothetical protein